MYVQRIDRRVSEYVSVCVCVCDVMRGTLGEYTAQ